MHATHESVSVTNDPISKPHESSSVKDNSISTQHSYTFLQNGSTSIILDVTSLSQQYSTLSTSCYFDFFNFL